MKTNIIQYTLFLASLMLTYSCKDYLDRKPIDKVTPEAYFNTDSHLAAYSIKAYNFDSHTTGAFSVGTLRGDAHTDNIANVDASYYRWVPRNATVPNKADSYSKTFKAIRNCNYFFEQVLPKHKLGEILGDEKDINHYIGEMYFLRAWNYYSLLKSYGDAPIVKNTLVDNNDMLVEASQRRPRNEVARFILQNLDSAIVLMQPIFENKNRLSSTIANLIKSRVALYEGSWLTYHRGTPFVPGGEGWMGASAVYNKDFIIDIDGEIDFFLSEAMSSSKAVADAISLTFNSDVVNPTKDNPIDGWNLYFDMFSTEDMGRFDEVLFWREYSREFSLFHGVALYVVKGGAYGVAKGYIDGFIMRNGFPIYHNSANYKGDDTFDDVLTDRDGRLQLFLGNPASKLTDNDGTIGTKSFRLNGIPHLFSRVEERDATGYFLRKMFNYNPRYAITDGTLHGTYGSLVFRAAEAYLNYIEASYMKNDGNIDADADKYWKAIRKRANIPEDYQITIGATTMSEEAKGDWGAYSNGIILSDVTLYNIRRERRNEFIGETFRWDDLRRWRALDQVKGYQIEGFNLWGGENHTKYVDKNGNSTLVESGAGVKKANVSNRSDGDYLMPYRITIENNEVYDGYTWTEALYLSPIPAYEILITSHTNANGSSNLDSSPLYQNPYWPKNAGGYATQ